MIFNPWRRVEPLDHTELARLLPAPSDPVLSEDRQRLLEDFLMNNATDDAHRVRSRRRMAVRLAAPAALAAALAGTVLAINRTTAETASPATATNQASAGDSSLQITNAAYTLKRDSSGTVTAVIGRRGALDTPARLQKDLERLGVPVRLDRNDPTCQARERRPLTADGRRFSMEVSHGVEKATIRPDLFPPDAYLQVVYAPPVKGRSWYGFALFVERGTPPACRHMGIFDPDAPVVHLPAH